MATHENSGILRGFITSSVQCFMCSNFDNRLQTAEIIGNTRIQLENNALHVFLR